MITRKKTPLLALCIALMAQPVAAQDPQEVAVARTILTQLQMLSFDKRREYCGFIGYDAQARLVASDPVPGTQATCSAPFPTDLAIVASYHTHGDFDLGYFNEVPSDIDVESDRELLINGYVSTPGGRLWYVDGRAEIVRQICGLGCLPVAPGFRKGINGHIAEQYTFDALRAKLYE